MNAIVEHLRAHGERAAVLTETTQLTYRELADRVADAAHALGGARRVVLLETRNDSSTLVHYLGALAARHAVLPVPAGRDHTTLQDIYSPDIVIDDRPENCLDVVVDSRARAILVWREDERQLPTAARRLGIGVVKSVGECLDILAQVDSPSQDKSTVIDRVLRLLGLKDAAPT